jgi:hypothetical protein
MHLKVLDIDKPHGVGIRWKLLFVDHSIAQGGLYLNFKILILGGIRSVVDCTVASEIGFRPNNFYDFKLSHTAKALPDVLAPFWLGCVSKTRATRRAAFLV